DAVRAAGFELKCSIESGLEGEGAPLIAVDEDAIAQIVINLVDNALKFSASAERKEVDVAFTTEAGGRTVVLSVRDFGPGVPRAEQRKIFELFYRSENELTRKTTGTGIGLALVRELAAGMNAQVDYRSREPGSEFRVEFQRVK